MTALSVALIAALSGWAASVGLFLRYARAGEETASLERKALCSSLIELADSHRREIAGLNQARIEEVAGLLQRIQAPETAVAVQAARDAPPDPVHPDISSDDQLFEYYQSQMANRVPNGGVE